MASNTAGSGAVEPRKGKQQPMAAITIRRRDDISFGSLIVFSTDLWLPSGEERLSRLRGTRAYGHAAARRCGPLDSADAASHGTSRIPAPAPAWLDYRRAG